MDIQVKGKQIDVGDALRTHVMDHLADSVSKYFSNALDGSVVFSKQGHSFLTDVSVHAGRGMMVQGSGKADDAYAAFDQALERISKQLRRYKRKLKDHHKHGNGDNHVNANYTIFAADAHEEEVPEEHIPAIIAEMPKGIATLSVSEAVMHMDLADSPVVMFRNTSHGGLNVVYRRNDGNVGWIDPGQGNQA